jgi:tryptophan 2,3-dioxygenase
MPNVNYSDYLQLRKILAAQSPESARQGVNAHDETLFIIIHQVYELWFKEILHELDSVVALLQQDKIDDDAGEMGVIVRRLGRVVEIWKLLISQVDILETMTSQDFLEFRNLLTPASGFQSVQFKVIEAKLGLRIDERHGGEYYKRTGMGGLSPQEYEQITSVERQATLKSLLVNWLERMPFLVEEYWGDTSPRRFWADYRRRFVESLNEFEDKRARRQEFGSLFVTGGNGEFSPAAMRSALFIMLYRDYPLFQFPFQMLTTLLDLDEYVSIWRYRHLMMVNRMIGLRIGTGGFDRAGKNQEGYLEGALRRHRIFRELNELSTYLVERRNLPPIPVSVIKRLSFHSA